MTDAAARDPAFVEKYGPWVLVSGASEGTGAEFSLQSAAKGCNVILVARRVDKLEELATKIRDTYGVQVETRSLDLSTPGAAGALEDMTQGKDVGLIVFNAGGDSVGGPFLAKPYEQWKTLTQRNIDMLTEACHRFATAFVKRGKGGILIVGSEAALGGTGRLAIYTATKGYALNFGESLWRELKPKGVDVLNVLIGATDTPKLRTVFAKNGLSADAVSLSSPEEIARLALSRLGHVPTVVLGIPEDSDSTLESTKIRTARIIHHSEYMNNFYGPE